MIKDLVWLVTRVLLLCLAVGLLAAYGLWPYVQTGWAMIVEAASAGLDQVTESLPRN